MSVKGFVHTPLDKETKEVFQKTRGEIYYMKRTKKVIASLALAGMMATVMPFNALAAIGVTTDRLSGANRYVTAVQISDQFGSATTAILAPAANANLVDALAAAPLAGTDAPILLTDNDTLTESSRAQLIKLGVTNVYVVGAISQAVVNQVNAIPGVTATVLKGANRIETAAKINAELTGTNGTFVVGYSALADALSVASYAAANNFSILVTNQAGVLPNGVTSEGPVYLVGSAALVKDIPGAFRLAGPDRWATNKAVIDTLDFTYDRAYVANGTQGHLVDALAGSSLAASFDAPIVLTNTGTGGDAAAATVAGRLNNNAKVTALGSVAVVTNNTLGKVVGTVGVGPVDLAIAGVSALTDDGHVLEVAFTKAYTGTLDKTMVSVFNTSNLARVGVEKIELASNGMALEVTMYDSENDDEIVRLTEYTITIGSLQTNFTRPGYVDSKNNARVVSVDAGERTITFDTLSGVPGTWPSTLDIPEAMNFDFQGILGQEIKAWFDGDDNLMKFELEGNKVLYGAIEINEDGDGLKVIGEDKEYDIDLNNVLIDGYDDTQTAYTSGGVNDLTLDTKYDYAKVIVNNSNDVMFVQVYEFEGFTVVEEVDGKDIIGYDGVVLETEDDYDVIVKGGIQIGVADVKKGDIIYFNEGGDGFAEVYNNKVTGEIGTVYNNAIKVNGKIYDTMGGNDYDSSNAKYLDKDGDYENYDNDAADDTDGVADFFLDRKGDLVYVTANLVDAASDDQDVYLTADIAGDQSFTKPQIELEFVDEAGAFSSKVINVHSLDEITFTGAVDATDPNFGLSRTYDIDSDSTLATKYRAAIVGGNLEVYAGNAPAVPVATLALAGTDNTVVNVTRDDDGTITELDFDNLVPVTFAGVGGNLELDDKYVKVGAVNYKLSSSTVVYDVTNADTPTNPDDDEFTVTTWGELKDVEITNARVWADGLEAEVLVITGDDADDTEDYTAVLTDIRVNSDADELVQIKALVDGVEKTFIVDKLTDSDIILDANQDGSAELPAETAASRIADLAEGSIVKLTVDASDVVTGLEILDGTTLVIAGQEIASGAANTTAVNLSDSEVEIGGTTIYELIDDAYVYDAIDPTDITVENLRDLRDYENAVTGAPLVEGAGALNRTVTIVLDADGTLFTKLVIIK